MLIYVDTNIFLSLFDKTARFRRENQLLLKQAELSLITSFLTIVEFRAIISILYHENQLRFEEDIAPGFSSLKEPDQIRLLIDYFLDQIKFSVYNVCIPEPESIKQIECKVDNNLRLAYQLSPRLFLHTLDLMHIASAMNIKIQQKIAIDYFLTNDQQILAQSKNIRLISKIIPISSVDLIQILKLNDEFNTENSKINSSPSLKKYTKKKG